TVIVEVILTDRMLNYIETGQRSDIISTHLPSGSVSSKLSRISPFLHPVTHSTEAEIELPNPENYLKSGMFTSVDIHYGESENATLVPLSALHENPLSGATGVYVSRDTANKIPQNLDELKAAGNLTEAIGFEFIPVDVLAKGRMSAGVTGIEPNQWVVTIGQDLFGGENGQAKMRPIKWDWVEYLQNLQREDLLNEILQKKNSPTDTLAS
ncbi:MAG: efflux RND transporter periplasmic adaptor subunit, partial [Calditrichaeota bacterium]